MLRVSVGQSLLKQLFAFLVGMSKCVRRLFVQTRARMCMLVINRVKMQIKGESSTSPRSVSRVDLPAASSSRSAIRCGELRQEKHELQQEVSLMQMCKENVH